MAEFSLFPTAYWAEQQAQGVAVVWKKGNSALFSFLDEQISWAKLNHLVQQAVTLLQKNAVTKKSLVAYSGSHRLAGLLCYLATLSCGAKILMLNPAMSATQRSQILQQNGVDCFLTDDDFAIFSSDLTACTSVYYYPTEPATFTLTSGSSGFPKAVVHSIQNHLDNADGVCELMNFHSYHSWLLSLPLFHVSGQGIVWRWLTVGATLWIAEDKTDFWEVLDQVSHASLVPTQLQRYLAQNTIAKGQKILLGGALIPSELIEKSQICQIETYSGYGMTEMASTICAIKNAQHSVGKPLKNREVSIENGEIWVRGAGLGLGYWVNQVLVPLTNEQGWFATKDKGEWLDGNLIVQGRLDNMFISGGENIQPEEIERTLFQSGFIKQSFVVPVDDIEYGQRPVAFVEFCDTFSTQAVKLLENFALLHLEKFKLPIAYFPLNVMQHSGFKISRQMLKALASTKLREKNND